MKPREIEHVLSGEWSWRALDLLISIRDTAGTRLEKPLFDRLRALVTQAMEETNDRPQ